MSNGSSIERVATALREHARELRPGDRLPSSRLLTAQYGISPVTLSRALATLAVEGVIVTRPGSGTFVAERPRRLAAAATGCGGGGGGSSGSGAADASGAVGAGRPDLSWQTLALGDRTVDAASVAFLLQAPAPGAVPLADGYPHPSLLPHRALAAALARAGRRPDASERPPPAGIESLRSWFA
ncbi:MAG: GntR family transcriptional regulator, partial [Actinomycetes bacterium]